MHSLQNLRSCFSGHIFHCVLDLHPYSIPCKRHYWHSIFLKCKMPWLVHEKLLKYITGAFWRKSLWSNGFCAFVTNNILLLIIAGVRALVLVLVKLWELIEAVSFGELQQSLRASWFTSLKLDAIYWSMFANQGKSCTYLEIQVWASSPVLQCAMSGSNQTYWSNA